ncbi:alpha/beta hydrolase [Saccharopolyspora shandongensis]|uniref:alpha/beta hydrolase n=1 Tax=Saccharopolyspora shandongensis TaxID=418495 RepID=UPI00344535A3
MTAVVMMSAMVPGLSSAAGTASAPEVIENIAYAPANPPDSKGHLLDLHLPRGQRAIPRPTLIVTGGSAWMREDGKDYAADLAPFFTDAGYVVAGVSIRSSGVAQFPAQVHDIKAAVRWLRAHAREYGIDPDRIAVMGTSSGGWTAAMAGVTSNVPELEGNIGVTGVSSAVQAVVDLYGPTDFLQMDEHMIDCTAFNERMGLRDCHNDPTSPESRLVGCSIQQCPDAVRAANPITYVDDETPPMLIAHGQNDLLVPHHQSELLFDALRSACRDAVFYSVPGIGHDRGIVAPDTPVADTSWTHHCRSGKLAGPLGERPTLRNIDAFLRVALAAGEVRGDGA